MDPSKGVARYCFKKRLANIKGKELQSILHCTEGPLFGISRATFERGHFRGTLFWFPLRIHPTDLSTSSVAYSERNLQDLLNSFKEEGGSMLLFLNNIEQIHGYTRKAGQDSQRHFSVTVADSCLKSVRSARKTFIERLPKCQGTLAKDAQYSQLTRLTAETVDHIAKTTDAQTWLIVNYYPGKGELSASQEGLCTNSELNYRPCVGIACPVGVPSTFQSLVFCTLPLPMDIRSATGLPVHVNGCFALSSNRRHLEWPDRRRGREFFENTVQWNLFLVEVLLPRAYSGLLESIVLEVRISAETFYSLWPDVSKVDDRWKVLAHQLYRGMAFKNVFFTDAKQGQWIALNQAVLRRFPPGVASHVAEAVVKVYRACDQNLVGLPEHVEDGLDQLDLLNHVKRVNARDVSGLVPYCLQKLRREDKLHVLEYLCAQGTVEDLADLQLLPLANQTFGVFTSSRSRSAQVIYWCDESMLSLFPDILSNFCDNKLPATLKQHLCRIAESGRFSVRILHSGSMDVPRLVQKNFDARFGNGPAILPSGDSWIEHVWQFLSRTRPSQDLGSFMHLSLLPSVEGVNVRLLPLTGIYVLSSGQRFYTSGLSPVLSSCLTKLGVTVISDLPSYVTQHTGVLGLTVQFPNTDGILAALGRIAGDGRAFREAVQNFNAYASSAEREELIAVIENASKIEDGTGNFLRQLHIFTQAGTKAFVSLQEVGCIGPDDFPPVLPRQKFLSCTPRSRRAAIKLGAQQKDLVSVVADMLMLMQSSSPLSYSATEASTFMKYFIRRRDLMGNKILLSYAKQVKFVKTNFDGVRTAKDLYEPTQMLETLFSSQGLLPGKDFRETGILEKLRKLDLRTEVNVQAEHLITAAEHIEKDFINHDVSAAVKKSEALWTFLQNDGKSLQTSTLAKLSGIICMPRLQDKPEGYPASLPLISAPAIVRPVELCSYKIVKIVGSSVPVMRPGMSEYVMSGLQIDKALAQERVVQHLAKVVKHYSQHEATAYKFILIEIFKYLNRNTSSELTQRLRKAKCVLVESGDRDRFVQPCFVWVQKGAEDIDLKPYRFPLASDLRFFKDLFLQCGSYPAQDKEMLRDVILAIQQEHEQRADNHPNYANHLKLVQKILDKLAEEESSRDGSVPVPIVSAQPNVLRFKPAKECTVSLGFGRISSSSDADTLFFVHPKISSETALALGALEMRARSLTGLEAIDFDYGQREDLRDRLKDLLEHSYRDGLSVPKELIQNADDAGASKVCFLLDERENPDCRSDLFYPQMASQQGPAVWAYNDAKFSEEDIENITRLGARTKQEDASKVGKFGLGFNAVYNLTDTPCFLSGHFIGMFDPEEKYLSGNPGMKIDFRNRTNQALLSRCPNLFKPFQGVFGCSLRDDGNVVHYDGTLFRFPLRTPQQEAESRLNAKCYNKSKRRDFIKLILEAAGNLLLFTQNVKEIQVLHIPDGSADLSAQSRAQKKKIKKQCLLVVRKTSRSRLEPGESTVLNYCKNLWQTQWDISILEELDICVELTEKAHAVCGVTARNTTTHWRLVWATGIGESASFATSHQTEGLLPLAAVAVPLSEDRILRLNELPASFYKKGHLFCFLPLPEEMVREAFPVHVNSTFSLTSSRRSLLERTEDDTTSVKTDWNRALFRDPICRAYILLLENLHNEAACQDGYGAYFELWPEARNSAIKESFYKQLISTGHKLFPVPQERQWVSFKDARFLEPGFRDSEYGSIAWKVLKTFWNGNGRIVDVPTNICSLLQQADERKFNERIVTKVAFYREVFFPHINSEHFSSEERDKLVFHALMDDDSQIQNMVRDRECIPCEATSKLRRPKDLVHPQKEAAKLFLSSEGLFPKGKVAGENEHAVHFRSKKSLERLARLGMTTDDLSPDRVLERTTSIGQLFLENRQQALDRARHLIDYMSSFSSKHSNFRIDLLPADIKSLMSRTKFLPVMKKPDEWPFPWNKDDNDTSELAPPCCLFSDSLKTLVACNAKLLDSNAMGSGGFRLQGKKRDILTALGLDVAEDLKSKKQLQLAISQLEAVTDHYQGDGGANGQLMQTVTGTVYLFLDACLRNCQTNDVEETIRENLASKRQVAFRSDFDCRPYLFKMESSLQQYRHLFEALGVRDEFGVSDGIDVLGQVHRESDGKPLPESTLHTASLVAQLLAKAVQSSADSVESSKVFLPDRDGYMCRASDLCLDDTNWLKSSNSMRFVSDKISTETAGLLGVKTKRKQDIIRRGKPVPRGPKEELTTRIKGLLKGYTFDTSVLKELIQNADDAGATEIKFIKDFGQLKKEKIPCGWERLQGPALCVYNNAPFTDEDLEGIIKVGEGSKGTDPLKTGQYGVGFNAVYHLTDAPSFYTRTNDGKEIMVAFDPNYQFLGISPDAPPGLQFEDVADMKESYPDMFQGYFENSLEMTKPGTIFRLPLRDEEMAKKSKIKQEAVSDTELRHVFDSFAEEMGRSLLFLTNLRRVAVYSVNTERDLVPECEVEKEMDEANTERMKTFQRSLQAATAQFTDGEHPTRIPESEAVLSVTLADSKQHTEDWVIVNKIGFAGNTEAMQTEGRQDQFKLLPRGGVAVQMSCCTGSGQKAVPKTEDCFAFCMLPLPVHTGLPVHVNGHFALDQEARRGLWDNDGDVRTEWNMAVALQLVVPAYIKAIQYVKHVWFPENKPADTAALQRYHALFPDLQNAHSKRPWALVMKELYKQVAELPLFPVVQDDKNIIAWAPVVKTNGFPGYFSNTTDFFRSIFDLPRREQNVVLTQGGVQTTSHQSNSERLVREVDLRFIKLLKDLNMNVIHTPYSIMKNFVDSGVDQVQEVCPATVISFLKSASSAGEDVCNIGGLRTPVSKTPFKDASNIQLFLKFVKLDKEFLDKLEGLPLCLRQSEQLYFFENIADTRTRPVASAFFYLLSGSSDMFLHKRIYSHFSPVREKTREMVQEMRIDILARMLPATISVSVYKTGQACPFLPDNLPCEYWLKDTWRFLEEQLKEHKDKELAESRQIMVNQLQCLEDWSLVPVKRKVGNTEELVLVPIKDICNVVQLSGVREVSHPDLWETLKSLPLPFLDTVYLPPLSIATKLVASISHPTALLQALTSCGTSLTASRQQAICVLSYFATSLPTLLESFAANESGLRQKLKSLPFFTGVDGNVGPIAEDIPGICIDRDIPEEGLTSWSVDRVVLLRRGDIPERLLDFLCFAKPSSSEFYSVYLLRTFQALPRSAIIAHMVFLRNILDYPFLGKDEMQTLCKRLKETAFIEVDGHMYQAERFYSPFEPVFREMEKGRFPPEPYCTIEWSAFMRKAGITWDVTDDMFVHYARRVERESQNDSPEDAAKKSQVLIHHLFRRSSLRETNLLERVRNIQFLPPSDWISKPEGPCLALIATPFSQDRLVSFAESCSEQHLHLVWTSSCILHPRADPLELELSSNQLRQLGWKEHAPEDRVMEHTKNLCRALDKNEPQNILVWEPDKAGVLQQVMTALYTYLGEHLDRLDRNKLAELPLICDTENKQMLVPQNVIINISDEDIIRGYINRLPTRMGQFVDLFEKLGVSKQVTPDHYARVLRQLKQQWEENELHVEAMKIVTKAIRGLFKYLKYEKEEERLLTVEHVYLPSEQRQLLKSTELVFKTDSRLADRCKTLPNADFKFFLGFGGMEIYVPQPLEEIRLLPQKHMMTCLSDIVKEKIPEEIRQTATEGEQSRAISVKLVQAEYVACVVRLANHQHMHGSLTGRKMFGEDNERSIAEKMSMITVKEVTGLKTVLELDDNVIPDSDKMKPSFAHRNEAGLYVVYFDPSTADFSRGGVNVSLAFAVRRTLKLQDIYALYLLRVFESPTVASAEMDDSEIARYNMRHIEERSFLAQSPPGAYVPTKFHCYLDNRLDNVFSVGDHVGFDLYDPQMAEDAEDNVPCYIYAVVRSIDGAGDETLPACRLYIIDVGPDHGGELEVLATSLYKFSHPPRGERVETSTGENTTLMTLEQSEGADTEEIVPLDMKKVLKEIREILTEAWLHPDHTQRRRVVKRLYLQWHPDKNLDNEVFCTRVAQAIQRYVKLLEQGRGLDDEEDADAEDEAPGPGFDSSFSRFFTRMDERSRANRDNYEENARDWGARQGDSSYRGEFWYSESRATTNPQPGEAKRWMRQAEADLVTAQAASGTYDRGHNWICYQCHQAVEKALKAVILNVDANQKPQSHDLGHLAMLTRNSTLLSLATQLQRHLGSDMRMRYPDAHEGGRIPAEAYESSHSWHACELASQALQEARSLI
ncbi:hypothetical protein BaRGS_00013387 [Batillaria attramentaria]|uniref:HEPN domain-containing protein n=1 Tax=Batillaria attramentaria TaxID=370345 RepID=A0ABD0L8G2_9CAEN